MEKKTNECVIRSMISLANLETIELSYKAMCKRFDLEVVPIFDWIQKRALFTANLPLRLSENEESRNRLLIKRKTFIAVKRKNNKRAVTKRSSLLELSNGNTDVKISISLLCSSETIRLVIGKIRATDIDSEKAKKIEISKMIPAFFFSIDIK